MEITPTIVWNNGKQEQELIQCEVWIESIMKTFVIYSTKEPWEILLLTHSKRNNWEKIVTLKFLSNNCLIFVGYWEAALSISWN